MIELKMLRAEQQRQRELDLAEADARRDRDLKRERQEKAEDREFKVMVDRSNRTQTFIHSLFVAIFVAILAIIARLSFP